MLLRDEAYEKSIALLRELSTEKGFLASKENVENYERVWARDGVIAGIASLLTGDEALIKTFHATLDTLRTHQDETGRIPSNVTPQTGATSYGTTVGRIDATLWYVIGMLAVAQIGGDCSFFDKHRASLDKALFYLKCLELNGKGLLYIPQGGDWADEYVNHGYVLYDEMLYYFALASYEALSGDARTTTARERLANLIRINYFPDPAHADNPYVYHKALFDYATKTYHGHTALPAAYFSNYSIHFHMDTFAIGLLLLSDLLDEEEREAVRAAAIAEGQHDGFPILPAFHPVITEKDYEWHQLRLNFLYQFRNKPNHFHNGGLWPLVHGFFLASAPQASGLADLDAFAQVLKRDDYVFPEYYHGETFEALGTGNLSFSASAYIIAYTSIVRGADLFAALTQKQA